MISLENLHAGDSRKLLAEADAVIAVDIRTGQEESADERTLGNQPTPGFVFLTQAIRLRGTGELG